jgi:hypothetical protein
MAQGISLDLPIRTDKIDGHYVLTKSLEDTVRNNFKNLILTVRGERIMDPEFGVGVHQLLFENSSTSLLDALEGAIISQTARYLPFVQIINVEINNLSDDNKLELRINYLIKPLSVNDVLAINISKGTIR